MTDHETGIIGLKGMLHHLLGKLVQPFEEEYLSRLRGGSLSDQGMKDLRSHLKELIASIYGLAAIGSREVLRHGWEQKFNDSRVVLVPSFISFLMRVVNGHSVANTPVADTTGRERMLLSDLARLGLDGSWNLDVFEVRSSTGPRVNGLDRVSAVLRSQQEDASRVTHNWRAVASILGELFESNLATRAGWLTQKVFLPLLANQSGTYSTGQLFTVGGRKFNGRVPKCLVVGRRETISSLILGHSEHFMIRAAAYDDKLDAVLPHFPDEAWDPIAGGEEKLASIALRRYLAFLQLALWKDADEELREFATNVLTEGSLDRLATELIGATGLDCSCNTMAALSCYDPTVGRSDGTFVIYSNGCFPAEAYLTLYEVVVPILTEVSRLEAAVISYTNLAASAQDRAYGFALRSILHQEGAFCRAADSYIRQVEAAATDLSAADRGKTLKYLLASQRDLLDEFKVANPLRDLRKESLYPTLGGLCAADSLIAIGDIQELIATAVDAFDSQRLVRVHLQTGIGLEGIGYIPNFNDRVLGRILSILINNSVAAAKKRQVIGGELELGVDIEYVESQARLVINAIDNCGGFDDPQFPRELTYDAWLAYVENRVGNGLRQYNGIYGGMGFFQLGKYAWNTDGSLKARTVRHQGRSGAEVTIMIGLQIPQDGQERSQC